ncbi:MAG: DUF1249 domain-containing protein [Oleispira antarctica]|uniref:Dehydrogenase n=1 Tax=Oleispira antarctica RB-8 TaxID=698738 RepID=R4YR16_OLEAN|nr:DUF1249 domain-containing protein [Oleispira antarctica]MBQ0792786.1 DUF1249 domain-containing protein [Oleispira antarctica]CCK77656.1 conserved hypothetical protein [Oleispira antarctica RB-8]|tara:strand:+ start:4366 stop:4839 length:474 start_codon:yes stop_codon:yes gene_type:complete
MALNRRYVPDLKKMAAACEGNYIRLNKLMPDFELGYEKSFFISGDTPSESPEYEARIHLKVIESFPYTSTIEVVQKGICPDWIQPPCMIVRVYHDARSAEVTSYQNQKRIHGKYQYPNPQMRMPDEKAQLNQFLAEWLTHCLKYGHAEVALDFAPLR